MRVAFALTVSCLALVTALPALAADLEAASKIDAVTVFPEAASVTRTAAVDLPAGTARIVFKSLPIGLDPASLRVTGEGAASLSIGSVETRVAPVEAAPDTGLDSRIKALRADRAAVQVRLDALAGKKAMIQRFAQAGPERLTAGGKPLDVAQWDAAWDAVGGALAKLGEETRVAADKARDLDEEIKGLEDSRQRPAARTGPARDVTVAVESSGAGRATLTLTYRVPGAGWLPVYDARLDTGAASKKPSLELVRRAAVSQQTGEAWTDVALTVSTVRTDRGTAAPDIEPLRIAFEPPPAPADELATKTRRLHKFSEQDRVLPAPAPAAPATLGGAAPLASAAQPATEQGTTLDAGAFQASFHVPGRVSIASDGAEKSFRLGSETLDPTLTVLTVPALDPTGYVQARVVNTDEAPLLPGEVSLLRDGTFIGRGGIGLVAPGDTLDLGFGADDRVKVARVPVKRKENDPIWLASTKIEADEFKTTVKNLHDFPIKLRIVDQIPYSETTTIIVEQLPATTPPTEKTVADKRGVMAWTYDVQPNETKEVRIAYRMRWPADSDVVFDRIAVAPH